MLLLGEQINNNIWCFLVYYMKGFLLLPSEEIKWSSGITNILISRIEGLNN